VFSVSSFDASLDKINNVYHDQSFSGTDVELRERRTETASESAPRLSFFRSWSASKQHCAPKRIVPEDSVQQDSPKHPANAQELASAKPGIALQNQSSRRKEVAPPEDLKACKKDFSKILYAPHLTISAICLLAAAAVCTGCISALPRFDFTTMVRRLPETSRFYLAKALIYEESWFRQGAGSAGKWD
jgi:hypothetical protein